MNTALIRALARVKCVSYVMTLPVHWILDKSKCSVSKLVNRTNELKYFVDYA